MDNKIIDAWTILHFIGAFVLTIYLHSKEIDLILIIMLIIFWELIEHSIMGDVLFKWTKSERKEQLYNSTMDVIVGVFSILLTYYFIIL